MLRVGKGRGRRCHKPSAGAAAAAILRTYNFVAGAYFNGAELADVACTRAAPATTYAEDESGQWHPFSANVPRITDKGLLIEQASDIRGPRNNAMSGAVAGTPGTMPTNWNAVLNGNLSRQIVSTGTENGLAFIEIRIFGTLNASSASSAIEFDTGATGSVPFGTGTTGIMSVFVAMTAGTTNGIDEIKAGVRWYNSGAGGASTFTPTFHSTATVDMERYAVAVTAPASTTDARPRIVINTGTSGLVVDVTLKIWAPQLEVTDLTVPSSPVQITGGGVTRNADDVTIGLGTWYNQSKGTMIVRGSPYYAPSAGTIAMLCSIDDGTANNRIQMRRNNSTKEASAIVLTGGVSQALINGGANTWLDDSPHSIVWAYASTGASFCENGGSVQTDVDAVIPTITQLQFGNGPNGTYLNGYLKLFAYYGVRRSDAELPALSRWQLPTVPFEFSVRQAQTVRFNPVLRDPLPLPEDLNFSFRVSAPAIIRIDPKLQVPAAQTGWAYTTPFRNYQGPGPHIYVSMNGNDTTGNGTKLNPYRTPQKALSVWSAGRHIRFRGTFDFGVGSGTHWIINRSGTIQNPIVIEGDPDDPFQSAKLLSRGNTGQSGIATCSKHNNIIFRNLEVLCEPWGATYRGLTTMSASGPYSARIEFYELKVHGFREDGIKVSQSQGGIYQTHCRIYDCGEDAFDCVASIPFLSDIAIDGAGYICAHNEIYGQGAHNGEGHSSNFHAKGGSWGVLCVHNIFRNIRDQPSFAGTPALGLTGNSAYSQAAGSPLIPGWGNGQSGGPNTQYYEGTNFIFAFNEWYDPFSYCLYISGQKNARIEDNIFDVAGSSFVISNTVGGGSDWPVTPRSNGTQIKRNRLVLPHGTIAINGSQCDHTLGAGADANVDYASLDAARNAAGWPSDIGPHWGRVG